MTENTTDRSYPKIVVGQFRDKMRRNFAFERAPMNASTQGRINSCKNNVERTHIGRFFFAFQVFAFLRVGAFRSQSQRVPPPPRFAPK
jgi:hypothetical protein